MPPDPTNGPAAGGSIGQRGQCGDDLIAERLVLRARLDDAVRVPAGQVDPDVATTFAESVVRNQSTPGKKVSAPSRVRRLSGHQERSLVSVGSPPGDRASACRVCAVWEATMAARSPRVAWLLLRSRNCILRRASQVLSTHSLRPSGP